MPETEKHIWMGNGVVDYLAESGAKIQHLVQTCQCGAIRWFAGDEWEVTHQGDGSCKIWTADDPFVVPDPDEVAKGRPVSNDS